MSQDTVVAPPSALPATDLVALKARQPGLEKAIGAIKLPTLLIAGVSDPVTTVADANAMHQAIPNSRIAEVPASHLSNLEAPAQFDAALAAFLAAGAYNPLQSA